MGDPHAPPTGHIVQSGIRNRLARLWVWLLHIETTDRLRMLQNRMLSIVLLIILPFPLLLIGAYNDIVSQIALSTAALAVIIAWYCNRRGTPWGVVVLIVTAQLVIALLVQPSSYTAPPDEPIRVDISLFLPIVIAALFLGPRAAALTCFTTIVLLAGGAWVRGIPLAHIINFLAFGGAAIIVISVLFGAGAAQYLAALRTQHVLNEELEQRVRERTADLNETLLKLDAARADIEQRAAARADEMSDVVHDMRNYMMTLSVAVEILLFDSENAGVNKAAIERMREVFERTMDAQRELLDALHEAALLESQALVLQVEPVDLAELVHRIGTRVRPRYDREQCTLQFDLAGELPLVMCDARRILRVFQNIFDNALIYTAAFRKIQRHVVVVLRRDGDQAVLQVIDNGPGIAPEQLKNLGERFRRVASGAGAPKGSGIGLNASIGIVALHGGSLHLISAGLGHGTTAELRLPLAPTTP